jgi:AcrR family transcriptional regulator
MRKHIDYSERIPGGHRQGQVQETQEWEAFGKGGDVVSSPKVGNRKRQAVSSPDTSVATRLLSTAAHLFWRQGYSATSTRQLSEMLGVQNATLYYHVRKKEDLLYEICKRALTTVIAQARADVSEADTPRERIERFIHGHLTAILEDKDQHATMLTELRSLSSPRRRQVIAMRDEYQDFIAQLIHDGQVAGTIRTDISTKILTLGLLDLLNWAIFWFEKRGELDVQSLATDFARIYLDGAATGTHLQTVAENS